MIANFSIKALSEKKVCWLEHCLPLEEKTLENAESREKIVVSSRIRLARNVKESFFPARADDPSLLEIRDICLSAVQNAMKELGASCMIFPVDMLAASEREFLFEQHCISREFLHPRKGAALAADGDKGIFVMVNEEDHLRIQMLAPGMCLKELWQKISLLDDRISARLPYAFDVSCGYLTGSPANTGTAMRASVMLHLPAMSLCGQLGMLHNAAKALGLAVCHFHGEGSSPEGSFYQISNQSTLGETESMLIARLERAVKLLCRHEEKLRLYLLEHKRDLLLNFIGRSYGMAKYSYSLKTSDALNALSGILLGVNMGMFPALCAADVKKQLLAVQKAHLQQSIGKGELSPEERESCRASLLRDFLQNSSQADSRMKKASSGGRKRKK